MSARVFARLGRVAYRRRWWVLGGWAVAVLAGVILSGTLFDRLTTVAGLSPQAESVQAQQRIEALVADGPVVFAVVGGRELDDPAFVASVSTAAEELARIDGVVDVDSLYTSPGGQVGVDGRSTLVRVELAENLAEPEQERIEDAVRARLKGIDAPTVLIGGDHLAERAFAEQAVRDLAVGESVALVLLLILLIVIFGGVVAGSVPVVVAVAGVSTTMLVLLAVSQVSPVGDYSLNIVTLLGLGLAVDYALLIVARYREERARGAHPAQAVETAMARAGRAVAISGLAVAAALAGLVVFAEPLLASMAVGGTAVVLLTTALALTAVPALIAVARYRIPPAGASTWLTRAAIRTANRAANRTTLLVSLADYAQRHARAVAVLITLGLLGLAAPLVGANFANSDARSLPVTLEERRAYDAYQGLFNANEAAPVIVVAQVEATSAALRDYLNDLNHLPGVFRLNLRSDVPAEWVIVDLTPAGNTAGAPSQELVSLIRATRAETGFPVLVTGEAAKVVDYQDSVAARLPLVVVAVVVAMLVLLYVLTGSVVVPVKAMLLNALTFIATLGILVAVFQWGWGEPVLRFDSWGALDLTTPLLLFVFIFGLSMDYEVFLLARIKEEYDRGLVNDDAVLAGTARSGPVVTAAALCITIVFLGFAAGSLVAVKEIGVGMAVAVVLDVTLVRGLLLPAAMTLLGDLNWWSPWRHRDVGVDLRDREY